MKRNEKRFATAYNCYQNEKNSRPFGMKPSKETQRKMNVYSRVNKTGQNKLIDVVFSFIS